MAFFSRSLPRRKRPALRAKNLSAQHLKSALALVVASATAFASPAECAEDPPKPAYGRAALEMLGFLGIGATWYWIDIDRNLADWDRLSFSQRFRLDAIRLDNNLFAVNHIGHPVSGAAYYTFARANGLSVPMASLYTLGTSMLWEYGLEFQERTSFNDFIVTPGAGIAVGQAVHALGQYLNSGCDVGWGSALGWMLGFPVALHQSLDGDGPQCNTPRDNLGFDARTVHSISLSAELSQLSGAESSTTAQSLYFQSELLNIEGYGQDRSFETSFTDGEWTQLKLEFFRGTEATGVLFEAHSVLAGYHQQRQLSQGLVGVTAGVGTGYRYAVRSLPGWRDQLSEMHLLAAYQRSVLHWRSVEVSLNARVSPDFSASNSLPLPQVRISQQGLRGKSVLAKQGYYYGFGWSGSVEATVATGTWALGLKADYSELHSIEGSDRVQEELTVDERGFDSRNQLSGYLQVQLPWGQLSQPFLKLHWDSFGRRSFLEGYREERSAQQLGLQVGVQL